MKNRLMQLAFTLLLLAAATNVASGQVCNIIRNSSFAQGSPAIGSQVDGTSTNVSSWIGAGFGAGGSPDVYSDYSIFMWDWSANPVTNPSLSNEYIMQPLCDSVFVVTTQPYNLSFDAATTARGLGKGRLEVILRNGGTRVVVATIPNLTLAMTNYQFNNITSALPFPGPSSYNQIIIRPVATVAGAANTMDIIVDNIVLGKSAAGSRYVMNVNCCQGSQSITYPGSIAGFDGLQWIDFSTNLVVGTTTSINVTPTKSGSIYLVRKSRALCSGGACNVTDTVILQCCGGDNDWEFSAPNGITSADQIHRTGDVNVGNIAIVPGAPDIAKVEIKHNDNTKWNCFMLNGGGNGKMLRIKGGFFQGQHSIFQVEANGATDYTEDYVRLMVRADGRVGIGTTTPNGTLHVNGDTWNTSGIWQTSDQRFKQNIAVIENPYDILKNIKGYRYDFKAAEFPDRNFNKGRQIGFIAQELKQVVPEAVMQGDDGYL
ncbi:MAG TPA: tail fiber domain-containing protein, partial [Chitinophagaceae bacterium]|nr:tail fiber domain-containing protein [Chitinophagaceae bacterium]